MLACNEYCITGCNELSSEETKSLVLLYHEITKSQAIYLYTLLVYKEKTGFRKLNDLLIELNFSLDVFEELLTSLETVGLVDTYQNHNQLVFSINKPLLYAELIHDKLFGRLLLSKVGNEHYRYLVSLLKPSINLEGFKKINHILDNDLLTNWDRNKEVIFNDVAEVKDQSERVFNYIFDINHFLKSVSSTLFPISLRTNENLKLISELADTYSIDENLMRQFVMRSISISPLTFDSEKLKNFCLASNKPNVNIQDEKDPYHIGNVAFLERLQGKETTIFDRRLIGDMAENYHLNTEVINVLLEYAYNTCNHELNKNFISQVASNWNRNNIDTKEKAFKLIEERQNYKRYQQSNKKGNNISTPDYNVENNFDISPELLDEYFGKNK